MRIEFESLYRNYKSYIDENRFREMVAECAYYKSEKRGFTEGFDQQDWLEAEQEISKQCHFWFQEY